MLRLHELPECTDAWLFRPGAHRGIDAVLECVNGVKKDFQGEKLFISLAYEFTGPWKLWKKSIHGCALKV